MILLNEMEKQSSSSLIPHLPFLKLLHPFAPHLAQELWFELGNKTILDFEPWPAFDPKLIEDETFTLVIQVNGRTRDTVEASAGVSDQEAKEIALGREKIKALVGNAVPKNIIYVSKKLVNIVI